MKKTELLNGLNRAFHKAGFTLKKHSPEILIVAGVAGTVVSAVLACKATMKVNEILEENKKNRLKINEVKHAADNGKLEEGQTYTEQEFKKDLMITYAQTGLKLAKLYAPAVVLGVFSLGGIITSNRILRKRNLALAAAYATIDKGFKEYRNRVVTRFGEEIDRELKYNIKAKTFEETTVDEKGKEKKVNNTVNIADPNTYSAYARFFDEGSTCWEKNAEYNLMFLRSQQQYANDLLKVKGRLFLNDVYDMLGIPRSKAGQVVGWVYNSENPVGDNYIDFGIYDICREKVRDFVNGYERAILLDFNVDGNIWELM